MPVPAHWLEPAFHPTYARLLCMQLRQRGVPTQRLLEGTGLNWAELVSADQGVSFMQMRALVQAALRLAGSSSLAMELGAQIHVSAHGPVGYAALASKDVEDALHVITRYARLRSKAIDFRLVRIDEKCRLQICELFDLGDVRIPILEAALIVIVTLFEALLGHSLDQAEYRLPYPEPPWAGEYAARLKGKTQFNAPHLEICLPDALLAEPSLASDPAVYMSALRDCEQGLAGLSGQGSVAAQVRLRLQGREDAYPSCEAMADELHMSARTLIRKLKQSGTSYQTLLDEVRKEQAHWYLRHTGHSVELIAERLGYLDTSNFSRTFRRWFGVSPKTYRQKPDVNTPDFTGS
ncbi:MAG TPA: AraC family transcriptional regulator [Noviherbaspirillum sp.]|nr:AraC family transcriptional regulator [Noviherbaspirillum sp.]